MRSKIGIATGITAHNDGSPDRCPAILFFGSAYSGGQECSRPDRSDFQSLEPVAPGRRILRGIPRFSHVVRDVFFAGIVFH